MTQEAKPAEPFVIALPIYEGVDLLDVAPPYGLVILIAGEAVAREVQLMTQYFPDPPLSGIEIPEVLECALPPRPPAPAAEP